MADSELKSRLINQTSANNDPQPMNYTTQSNEDVGCGSLNHDQENNISGQFLNNH